VSAAESSSAAGVDAQRAMGVERERRGDCGRTGDRHPRTGCIMQRASGADERRG
jgi:hypothetical protein